MLKEENTMSNGEHLKTETIDTKNDGSIQQAITTVLESPLTPNEYFKDLEKTGQYPEELQECIKNGDVFKILEILKNKGLEFIPSKDGILRLPEDKEDELRNLSCTYFGIDAFPLNDFSGEGDMECTRNSNLYTIVKIDGMFYLVGIAGGEFNRKTFTGGSKHFPNASFHKSEIPLFVVNQRDSYFAGKGKPQADIRNIDVRLYLELFTQISSLKPGEASLRKERRGIDGSNELFDWSEIKVPQYDELKSILMKKRGDKNNECV